jgi:hypothetical protein
MQLKAGKKIGTVDPLDPEDREVEGDINLNSKIYSEKQFKISPSTLRALITPKFLTTYQCKDKRLHNIIISLRTTPRDLLPAKNIKELQIVE